MTKERRLGRGLEALLGRSLDAAAPAGDAGRDAAATGDGGLLKLSVYEIDANPYQPRRDFDEEDIRNLSESIKDHGLLQPIVVRVVNGRYQLIAGERRLRAAIKAGWAQVPARAMTVDDRQMAELAIVENLQRKDLNALEKAASFQQYLEKYGCTQEDLANRLKIDRSTVANLIRLLELPAEVQDSVRRGDITPGHARALLPLGEEREQIAFAHRIKAESLSVRATEVLVQEQVRAADREPLDPTTDERPTLRNRPNKSDQLVSLEQDLRAALGTKVEVRSAARGRGKIVIHFTSHDEFERLHQHLARTALRQAG